MGVPTSREATSDRVGHASYRVPARRSPPDLSSLPAAEAAKVRQRLSALDRVCGCGLGAALATAALVLWLAVALLGVGLSGHGASIRVGGAAAVFVAGAMAGKALARLRARRARDRLLDDLLVRTPTRLRC
jgi:hypothetical protein